MLGTTPTVAIGVTDGVEPGEYGQYTLSADDDMCDATLDRIQQGVCSSGVEEKQTVVTSADSDIGGTFVLTFRGVTSAAIAMDASATIVKTRLEAMSSVGTVGVSRRARNNGFVWDITFTSLTGPLDRTTATGEYLTGLNAAVDVYQTVVVTR